MKIEIENLKFRYEKNTDYVLSDITLSVGENSRIGIIGTNGAGKSTLLKLLVGLGGDHEGSICIDSLKVCKKNIKEIRKKAGFLFQDSDQQLFCKNILEDVSFGPINYGTNPLDAREKAVQMLQSLSLKDFLYRPAFTLSGGQKKLAALATIMVMEPEILLLDEPSNNLDPKNRRFVIEQINSYEKTKIIASHDLDFILDTCDRVILLSNGAVVADGSAKDVLTNEEILVKYELELPLSLQRRYL